MLERSSLAVGAVLCAALVGGCTGALTSTLAEGTRSVLPASFEPTVLLAAAAEPTYVELPPADRWPRSMRGGGPIHAVVLFAPYVGMFGALADIERADAGTGFGIAVGYGLPVRSSSAVEIAFVYEESSHHNPTSDVDGHATRLGVRLGASFNMAKQAHPFVAVGVESCSLEFDDLGSDFAFSGPGFVVCGGIDYAPAKGVSLRAEFGLHVWDAADGSDGGGVTETLTVGLGARFGF